MGGAEWWVLRVKRERKKRAICAYQLPVHRLTQHAICHRNLPLLPVHPRTGTPLLIIPPALAADGDALPIVRPLLSVQRQHILHRVRQVGYVHRKLLLQLMPPPKPRRAAAAAPVTATATAVPTAAPEPPPPPVVARAARAASLPAAAAAIAAAAAARRGVVMRHAGRADRGL